MWEETRRTFLESLERVVRTIARLLPGLLALLLIVAVSAGLAILVRAAVRRLCDRLDLDRRLREWGVAAPAAEGRAGPSLLIARFATWTVLAIGFMVGLSALDATATSTLSMRLLEYLPHALVGLVILAAGLAGSRAVERGVLIGAVNMGLHSARLLGLGARWLVVVFAAAMALEHLGVGGTVLTVSFGILFGGIVLALALAVGLGTKDLIAHSLGRRFPPQEKEEAEREEDELRHL